MDSLRKLIKETLERIANPINEGHYTTWKNIEEGGAESLFQGQQSEIIQKLSKHLGIKKTAPLGSGTSGYAYYIPNNRVIKITKDRSEIVEAQKIKGKKCKHLANVYETYALGGSYNGIYVIVVELLGKSNTIDLADDFLSEFFDSEFGYGTKWFFEDYSGGAVKDKELKDYYARIKKFFEPKQAELVIWYMRGMMGILDELNEYGIKSRDYTNSNLGIKKNGNLAMYDMGYGDEVITGTVNNIHLNEYWSADEYPEFEDGQFNPLFNNRAYPPAMNLNTAPLAETELSAEEINKRELPYKFPNLFKDFISEKTESEVREIAPTLNLEQQPEYLIRDMEKNYPSLFDNFAEWIFNTQKDQTIIK